MKKILDIHFKFLFSKSVFVILILFILLITLSFINCYFSIDKEQSYVEIINNYYSSSIFYVKTLLMFVSCFLFSNSIYYKNDYVVHLLLASKISREKSFISKIVLNTIIITIFIVSIFVIFLSVGYFLILSFKINSRFTLAFFNTYLLCIIYGLLCMGLMQISSSLLNSLFPLFIYLIIDGTIDYSSIELTDKILGFVFPSFDVSTSKTLYGESHLLFLIIVYLLINMIIYKIRDLN